ncbi:MAG: ribonuclease Z [Clostridia bacterium]|nr:ribonuclease Z [Clostridia bacterium]
MHLIVCLDKRDGMLFNRRRQSSDRLLRQRLLAMVGDRKLWMNSYSARQFEEGASITVEEAFLELAGEEDVCFVENVVVTPYADRVKSITVYRWDKVYPADTVFPWEGFSGFRLEQAVEFAGYSHPTITEERYCR